MHVSKKAHSTHYHRSVNEPQTALRQRMRETANSVFDAAFDCVYLDDGTVDLLAEEKPTRITGPLRYPPLDR